MCTKKPNRMQHTGQVLKVLIMNVALGLGFRLKSVQFLRQAGFFAGSRIFMNQAFGYSLVQLFGSSLESSLSSFHFCTSQSYISSFHSCTKRGFLGSVQCTAFFGRLDAFYRGFDIWHCIHLLKDIRNHQMIHNLK